MRHTGWAVAALLGLGCQPDADGMGSGGDAATSADPADTDDPGTDGPAGSEDGSSGAPACDEVESMVLWAADGEVVDPMGLAEVETLGGLMVARSWSGGLGTLTLHFELDCGGPVYLWGFVWDFVGGTGTDNADSHFVSIDDQEEVEWLYGCNTPQRAADGRWAWLAVDAWNGSDCDRSALALDLPAGEHTIVIRNRESGEAFNVASIGAVVVSHDPFADPSEFLEPPP